MGRTRSAAALTVVGLALLAFPTSGQKVPDVQISHVPAFPEIPARRPIVAAAGDAVYVTWFDGRADPGLQPNTDIYLNRSLDAGATWLPADVQLDTGEPPGTSRSSSPWIVAVDDAVYVVWSDLRNGGSEILFNRSLDQGTSWLATPVAVDVGTAPAASLAFAPVIAATTEAVYVVWHDRRDGDEDVYFNRSVDDGATWLASDVRLDLGDQPGSWASVEPALAVDGEAVFVVWSDLRNSGPGPFGAVSDVYFNRSLDGGASWLGSAQQVETDGPGLANSFDARVAAVDGSVIVVWLDLRNGSFADVYANRSLDGGATWLASDVRLDVGSAPAAGQSIAPDLVATSGGVFAVWNDQRDGGDVYFNRSLDGGTTWQASDVRLNVTGPVGGGIGDPRVVASGSSVFVAWADYRHADLMQGSDIFMNRSIDSGRSWLVQELRLDTGSAEGFGGSLRPRLALSGNTLHAAWEDRRLHTKDESDVFYNLATGAQPYGTGHPGFGGHIPTLAATGFPVTRAPWSLDVANGLGGAFAILFLGLDGPAAIPGFGGTFLVQPPFFQFPFFLSGDVPGSGWFSFPVLLHGDPALIGTRLNLQVLVDDPGALPDGVSMSHGLEIWIG